jgi:hypothetical protein
MEPQTKNTNALVLVCMLASINYALWNERYR